MYKQTLPPTAILYINCYFSEIIAWLITKDPHLVWPCLSITIITTGFDLFFFYLINKALLRAIPAPKSGKAKECGLLAWAK